MNFSKMGDAGPYFSLLIKIGTTMVANILLFFSLGLALDKWLDLNGIPVFVGVFLGVGIGFYYVFKAVQNLETLTKDKKDKS
jgi:F0F1-type ATP synthase assembly protein I